MRGRIPIRSPKLPDLSSLNPVEQARRLRSSYLQVLFGLYIAIFFIRTAFGISLVAFSRYVDVGSRFQYGILVSAAPLAELLTVLLVGVFIDRYGRRGMLLGGLLLGGVSRYLVVLTQEPIGLALINFLLGVASTMILVSSLTLVTDYARPDSRGREMGAFDFANVFGYMIGFIAGLLLVEALPPEDLPWAFGISGTLAVLGFAYCFFYVREPKEPKVSEAHVGFAAVRHVATNPRVVLVTIPWLIVFIILSSIMTFLPFLSADTEGGVAEGAAEAAAAAPLTHTELIGVVIVIGAIFLATQIVFGRLSDRFGRAPIMIVGAIGFVGLTTTALLAILGAEGPSSAVADSLLALWPLLLVFTAAALAFGPSALAGLADVGHEAHTGVTMGVYSLVVSLGFILGPPAVGIIGDRFDAVGVGVFAFVCSLVMLALVLVQFYLWRKQASTSAFGDAVRSS
ncbi:MAG: MFS transporter [Methanobacteriota archaeon]